MIDNKKSLAPKTDYCYLHTSESEGQRPTIRTYERVIKESVAARGVYKTVDYIHKIYSDLTQEEIDKLFDDMFFAVMNVLDKH